MTRGSLVVSTMTKLSDDTERRLTASAGYDSFVHVHGASSDGWWTSPCSASTRSLSWSAALPNDSVALNGSSKAAHLMWSTRMWRLSGSISARSGEASKKYDGLRRTT